MKENIHEAKTSQRRIFSITHVGKAATIAQKLQRVARNKLHMKPRHKRPVRGLYLGEFGQSGGLLDHVNGNVPQPLCVVAIGKRLVVLGICRLLPLGQVEPDRQLQ